mgnify:CR=1 FL=1
MRREKRTKEDTIKKILPFLLVVIVMVMVTTIFFRKVDQKSIATTPEETTETLSLNTVKIHGVPCTPKNNIKTYLLMGLDASGEAVAKEKYDGTGQCDSLQVVVVDQEAGTWTRIPINRDTMTEVRSLDEKGNYLATTKVQIAMAHANGDGMELSCENTVDAVSNLLYGQKIDGYASLNLDAIEVLNHLVGGVTVTIEDDFSQVDPDLQKGKTVTLTDEQAMTFVRGRKNIGDQTNENRMKRQTAYLKALEPKLREKCQSDSNFPLEMYDEMQPYMVTNLSRNDFIKLAADILDKEEKDILEIKGTSAEGDHGFNEFTADKDSLADVVIEAFYNKIKGE